MEGSISDFFKGLKERFSNPFFASFIIFWCSWNWRVIAVLFSYQEYIKSAETKSLLVTLIENEIKKENYSFWHPFGLAVVYTIATPFIRIGFNWLRAWTTKWNNSLVFNVSREAKVNMEKYLSLEAKYHQKKGDLERIINEQKSNQDKVLELDKTLTNSRIETQKVKDELINLHDEFNKDYLRGYWLNKHKSSTNRSAVTVNKPVYDSEEYCHIGDDGRYLICEQNKHPIYAADIIYFRHDKQQRKVFFIKRLKQDFMPERPTRYLYNELNVSDNKVNGLVLHGQEDGYIDIRYERLESLPF